MQPTHIFQYPKVTPVAGPKPGITPAPSPKK
jgi:hypothetical protein